MKLLRGKSARRIRRREIIAELIKLGMLLTNVDNAKQHIALCLELQELCIVDETQVGNIIKRTA